MLAELSAIKEFAPTSQKRQRVSVEAELPPSKVSRTSGHAENAQTFDLSSSSNNSFNLDTNSMPTNDWDLRKLFFTELNYLQGNFNSMQGLGNMFSVPGGGSYDPMPPPPAAPLSSHALNPQFNQMPYNNSSASLMPMNGGGGFGPSEVEALASQEFDLASLWSDVPTALGW